MESAPRDGTRVLVCTGLGEVESAYWDVGSGGGEWIGDFGICGYALEAEVTRWMALPAPPEGSR